MKTVYSYDDFGNSWASTTTAPDSTDVILHTAGFGTAGANPQEIPTETKNREHIVRTTAFSLSNHRINTHAGSNDPFASPNHVHRGFNGARTDFEYDSFKRLNRVNSRDGSTATSLVAMFNTIGYNALGRVGTVGDGTGLTYGFDYNEFGDVTEYSMQNASGNRRVMMSKEYCYAVGDSCLQTIETFNPGQSNSQTQTLNFDRYGRLQSLDTDGTETVYSHQALAESPSVAQISRINDAHSGEVTHYRYDDMNQPCGYRVNKVAGTGEEQLLNVTQTSHGRTQYVLGAGNNAETYETEIEYDDNVLANPRVKATRLYLGSSNPRWFRDNKLIDFSINYNYDALGRLDYKIFEGVVTGGFGAVYNYNGGSTLVDHMRVGPAGRYPSTVGHRTRIDYTYDERANVCTVTDRVLHPQPGNPAADFNSPIHSEYCYDYHDRITREKKSVNDSLNADLSYEYTDQDGVDRNRIEKIVDNLNSANTRRLIYNSFGQLTDAGDGSGERAYDFYGNCTSIGGKSLSYTRGDLLSSFDGASYSYNHQGVRVSKTVSGQTTVYFLDGDKILGENRGTGNNSVRLRYVYDAAGLCGVRYSTDGGRNYINYLYLKDALGNITGIATTGTHGGFRVICRYSYNAFGETQILNPRGTVGNFADDHIATANPFRWKSHYFDTETGFYYIDGKYYDPNICAFISVDRPENLLHNASVVGGLNRYGITIDNPVALVAAIWTIYTASALYTDRGFERTRTWWESALIAFNAIPLAIRIMIGIKLIAAAIAITVASKGAGAGILVGVMMGISIATATVIGGVQAHIAGGSFLDGALNGFANGVLFAGVFGVISAGIGGIVGAVKSGLANAAKKTFFTVQGKADIVRLKAGGQPWPSGSAGGSQRALLGEGLYTFAKRSSAKIYLTQKSQIYSNLKIYKVSIAKSDLASMKTLDISSASNDLANVLLYDKLSSGIPLDFQHIIRVTGNFGIEHFFDKSVIGLLGF